MESSVQSRYCIDEVIFYMVQNWFNDEVGVCSIVHHIQARLRSGTFVLWCRKKTFKRHLEEKEKNKKAF